MSLDEVYVVLRASEKGKEARVWMSLSLERRFQNNLSSGFDSTSSSLFSKVNFIKGKIWSFGHYDGQGTLSHEIKTLDLCTTQSHASFSILSSQEKNAQKKRNLWEQRMRWPFWTQKNSETNEPNMKGCRGTT